MKTSTTPKQAVIAAGGLGTRQKRWSAFAPKEFMSYQNRPGVLYLIEELADAGIEEILYVYNPYYTGFIEWFRKVLESEAQDYKIAVERINKPTPLNLIDTKELEIKFIPETGPYSDMSSIFSCINLIDADNFILAFADNISVNSSVNPTQLLLENDAGANVALGSALDLNCVEKMGVIITDISKSTPRITAIHEKPNIKAAETITANADSNEDFFMLEGRFKLSRRFVESISLDASIIGDEPKLSKAIHEYSQHSDF